MEHGSPVPKIINSKCFGSSSIFISPKNPLTEIRNGKINAYPNMAEAADVTRSNSGVYWYFGFPWFCRKLAKLPQMVVEKHNVTATQNGPYKFGLPWRAEMKSCVLFIIQLKLLAKKCSNYNTHALIDTICWEKTYQLRRIYGFSRVFSSLFRKFNKKKRKTYQLGA